MSQTQNIANAEQDRHEKYENKRKIKPVSFNLETEKALFDYAQSLDFSNWVKEKLKEQITKNRA